MDPKANIRQQVAIARTIVGREDDDTAMRRMAQEVDAMALAELVLALDEWRRKGGFDPYA